MIEKQPNNIEVEKTVLGAMMLSKESLLDASSLLVEDDFYERKHQIIFSAILDVQQKGIPVDIKTVTEALINLKELDKVGGVEYLQELCESIVSFSSTEHYIHIVQDQSYLRNLLNTMDSIIQDYNENEIEDIGTFIGDAARRVDKAAEKRRISSFATSKQVTEKVRNMLLTQKKASEDGVTGVTTGYRELNLKTHGFQPSDIIILAARPSVGKTALGLNIAFNAASKTKTPVAIFSLEMPSEQLILRLLANRSCVDLGKIQTGFLTKREQLELERAMNELAETKLYIDDTPGIKLMDILAKSRKLKTECPDLSLIMIDYIGLITTGAKKVESRQLEVSEISRSLKELARELKIPILVISQLSRAVDSRTGSKKPVLSDLRESGSIEQDADQVLLLYREDYYAQDKKGDANKEETKAPNGEDSSVSIVKVLIAKNRNGQIGEVELTFTKSIGRFDDSARPHEEDDE